VPLLLLLLYIFNYCNAIQLLENFRFSCESDAMVFTETEIEIYGIVSFKKQK
jgi:hypothetical protein